MSGVLLFATPVYAGGFTAQGADEIGGYWTARSNDGVNVTGTAGCDKNYQNCSKTALQGKVIAGPKQGVDPKTGKTVMAVKVDWVGFGQRVLVIGGAR